MQSFTTHYESMYLSSAESEVGMEGACFEMCEICRWYHLVVMVMGCDHIKAGIVDSFG